MMKKTALFALSMLLAAPAYAAHPLVTDDTGTQGTGKAQLEFNNEFSWNKTGNGENEKKETGGETSLTLSYGLGERVDIVASIPFQWHTIKQNDIEVGDESGISDMSLEVKWRFYELEERGFSLALKPGVTLPTGDEKKGFGSDEICPSLTLIASKEGDFGALHANVGYSRNGSDDEAVRKAIWHASFAAELNMTENLRAVANIGMETNEDKNSDTDPAFLIGGLIYSVSENLDIDLGLKCGLNDAETDTSLLAGLAIRF